MNNRYYRWAMVIARAEGALAGARRALEKHAGGEMTEMRESERELTEIRNELRDLAVREAA